MKVFVAATTRCECGSYRLCLLHLEHKASNHWMFVQWINVKLDYPTDWSGEFWSTQFPDILEGVWKAVGLLPYGKETTMKSGIWQALNK